MKRIATLLLAVAIAGVATAQHRQEVSVNAGAGLSSLIFSYGNSEQKLGFGGKVGLGYQYFLSPSWGVVSGVDFGFYNATSTLARNVYSQPAIDGFDGSDFTFTATYTGYEEKASTVMLTIPLMAQYQTGDGKGLYVAFGAKVGIPISAKYKASGHLLTEGNYGTGFHYSGDLPERGFTDSYQHYTADLDLKASFMLALELGAKWQLPGKYILYTGAYCDYGLNNINGTNTNGVLVAYQSQTPADFKRQSVAGSSDRMNSLAIGVTLRLSLDMSELLSIVK